ncbi:unnamed protein product, partial [marine sediment metagenome]
MKFKRKFTLKILALGIILLSALGWSSSEDVPADIGETTSRLTDVIYIAAGIVAAIMLVIHGLKLISSQNPEDRDDAKKAILFVIFALVIIVLAEPLVNEFASQIDIPEYT